MRHLTLFAAATLGVATVAIAAQDTNRVALDTAVSAGTRTPTNTARDRYRNPAETLAFFQVKPTDTVIELWPGGGWYTEILAPYLQAGRLIGVAPANGLRGIEALKGKDASTYGRVETAAYDPETGRTAIDNSSADVVLTFRNVHNWRMGGVENAEKVFAEAYRVLKPGGVLGVVEHRLPEARDSAAEEKSGYMKTSSVVALATKAGFTVDGQSEVNANPKDSADWPQGVWTLPPVLRLKDVDRAKYQAIGESDRMTIRFRKPAA